MAEQQVEQQAGGATAAGAEGTPAVAPDTAADEPRRLTGPAGERRFAQPTSSNVRPVNSVLTGMSIGFSNSHFIADEVAPPVRVDGPTGSFFIWTRDYWFRRQSGSQRAPEGEYLQVGYGVTTATFETRERGFEKLTGRVTQQASQTPESLLQQDVRFLTNLMQLEVEKDVAAAAFTSGVWGTDVTLSGTGQWSDYANSNPIADIETGKRTIRRNTGASDPVLIIGALVWEKLKEHPLLLEKYKHSGAGVLTQELVAKALGVKKLVVGEAVENTAAEGAAFSSADIWTDSALLLAQTPGGGVSVPNGAYRLVWPESGAFPWGVEQYYWEPRRSDVTRIFSHWETKVTSSQHGYMVLDTVA